MDICFPSKIIPSGVVSVSGAKNSATKLMAAALMSDETTRIYNFPTNIEDVKNKSEYIRACKAKSDLNYKDEVAVISGCGICEGLGEVDNITFRTTYLLVPAQLIRYGYAKIPYPGGCSIGDRKIDIHLDIWRSFGGAVNEMEDGIEVVCDKMAPADISLPISTVGGTENALLCAACVNDRSVIRNAYITPETVNLIELLKEMGVNIHYTGSSEIVVNGVDKLRGATIHTIPDRIEALTWVVYAVLSKGDITIKNVPFDYMEIPLVHLMHAGIDVFKSDHSILIKPDCLGSGGVEPFEVACGTYPGIISDMQPLFVLLALAAKGNSRIVDYRYPGRTNYIAQLLNFVDGGRIEFDNGDIRVKGNSFFCPGVAHQSDLRGTISTILAAMIAGDGSKVSGIEMALRGYNKFLEKLDGIGVEYTCA